MWQSGLILFFGLLVTSSSGIHGFALDSKIIGGVNAEDGQFPFMVQMKFKSDNRLWCGASLISQRSALIAAQCIAGYITEIFKITVGSNSLLTGGSDYDIWKFIAHEYYNRQTHINDIGLIITTTSIALGDNVAVINLPPKNLVIQEGENAVAMGWGDTGQFSDSLFLKIVNLTMYSNSECSELLGETVVESQICAGGPQGKGVCNGDAGDPLVISGTVVGVVSHGIPCATGVPDIYTSIPAFSDWILDNLWK